MGCTGWTRRISAIGAGRRLLQLGQPDQATVLLDQGIAQLSKSFIRERQIDITYLADALARPGKQRDLEAAAGLGMESLDLAESLNSTRGTDLLRDLYFQMKPHDAVPAVREFLERAMTSATQQVRRGPHGDGQSLVTDVNGLRRQD